MNNLTNGKVEKLTIGQLDIRTNGQMVKWTLDKLANERNWTLDINIKSYGNLDSCEYWY